MPLAAFAALFTRSFEDYFYPGAMTTEQLTTRVRVEQLDLSHSIVMLLDDEPAGQALLGLRADHAWCGGFGIVKSLRGRGLAHELGQALLDQARRAGATRFSLEVLTRNTAALRVYSRLGLAVVRDLQIFEWAVDDSSPSLPRGDVDQAGLVGLPARELLEYFAATHTVAAAWQRDLPALLVRPGLHGLGYANRAAAPTYVLITVRDSTARIEDLGARSVEDAIGLLQQLQQRYSKLVSVNEPGDSPITAAYGACGFREVDRQHEMVI